MAFNVNAARAQRLEAHGATFDFTVDGETFSLPLEVMGEQREKVLAAAGADELLTALLGEQAARFATHETSIQDIVAIVREYNKATAASLGEDAGSAS